MYSQQTLKDGTTYVKTEDNLFKNPDGTSMTERDIYNALVGTKIVFNDGTSAEIVKRLPKTDMYNELFKRHPRTKNIDNIKQLNKTINSNINELLSESNSINTKPDVNKRHSDQNITDFNTREVLFYDGDKAYSLTFSIGILENGKRVAYAKKMLKVNSTLLGKIKHEDMSSTSNEGRSSQFPQVTDNISHSNTNVNSDTSPTRYSMQSSENNTQELDNSSFNLLKNVNNQEINRTEINKKIKELNRNIYSNNSNLTDEEKQNAKLEISKLKDIKNKLVKENNKINIDEEINNAAIYLIKLIDNGDVVNGQLVDEVINELPSYKETLNDDEIDEEVFNKYYDLINAKLSEEGISSRYDDFKNQYIFDRRKLAMDGYNDMLDYLSKNNISYEISHSTEAGYVPSIYIKDEDGDTIFRIANHDNGYIDDFDITYNDTYNKLFNDKDYANWKENILPKIEKVIGKIDKQVNYLKNADGQEINISDLKENSTMERFHYNRKYDKNNISSYRGISDNTGSNGAFYGLGLYTTLDKNYAKKYGDVVEIESDLLPDNPLKFKTQNDFKIWEQELARDLGIRKSQLYGDDYGVEQYIKKLGYDGLMIGTGKDTDLISYKDVAIKYSKNNKLWQEYLETNYKSKGTKTILKDIVQQDNLTAEEKIYNKKKKQIENKYQKTAKEKKKIISKEASRILQFSDYKVKKQFQELLSTYYDNPNYDKIKNDIKANFSEQRVEYINEEIKDIKKEIRTAKLKIPDYVKKSIIDYNYFRKSNFGKLKLSNEGQSIDSFYNEIADSYPNIFSKEITNEAEQLKRLSEFMSEDIKIAEKYKIDDKAIEEATKYIYDAIKNQDNIDDLINSISISPKEIRKEKTAEYREFAESFLENSSDWKDKNMGISYKTNTMKRNFYDVMSKSDANKLYSNFIEPIFIHNSQMQNDVSKYNDEINKLKLNDNESIAVQMFGEYKYNPETLVTGPEVDDFIEKNKLDYKKIENAVEVFRKNYDNLFERMNEILKAQGYKELDYRKGYFPHFTETHPDTKFGKMLEKIGFKFKDNSVPTTIAGITDMFKPGKVWTSFSQQRIGKYTDYNALKGFDNYIRGAMETIYFTEDIQKLRALENEIRYQHSDIGIQTKIDEIQSDDSLTFDEKQDKLEKIYSTYLTPLNNFVTELRDYTNSIANKKSGLDRTMESLTNREVYGVMQNVSNRLSANMVGLNLSSAITNFIPITQATSQIKSKYLIKGLKEAIKNQYSSDNFELKSVFLTSRLNASERLYKTKLEKISDKANFMFEAVDSITSNTIVRGKYYENIAKGMSESNALRNADEFEEI